MLYAMTMLKSDFREHHPTFVVLNEIRCGLDINIWSEVETVMGP